MRQEVVFLRYERIEDLRIDHNLTQQEIADILIVAQTICSAFLIVNGILENSILI